MNVYDPVRQDEQAALDRLAEEEAERIATVNGFYRQESMWEVFERHSWLIVGGVLFGSAVVYLLALIRGL